MLHLSSGSRRFARHTYVCGPCLAALAHREALSSIAPTTSSLRIQRFATTPISSAQGRKLAQRKGGRAGKKDVSKAPDPSSASEIELPSPEKSSDGGPRRHLGALQPTSLKDALNTLRTALENRGEPAKKAKGPNPKKQSPLDKASTKSSKKQAEEEPASEAPSASSGETTTKKKRDKKSQQPDTLKISSIESKELALTPVVKQQPPVPNLSYGLDRVLFNPGVYHLQDPRSRVFNFDPYLAAIMPIKEFDFNSLKQYVTSSKDTALTEIAAENMKKYSGSTSSMTSMLAHFHFLLSAWRPVNPAHISRGFQIESTNFTRISRSPAAIFLHWKNGTYAIDADKEFDSANILSMLGKSMEKLLTLSKEDFEKYRRTNSDQLTEEERNGPESYHYTTMGDFLMRSQLDAHDNRLPGTGMFDLKTRAVVSIRMDAQDFWKGLGYEIRHRIGQWESYEREYYDMVRSAFLKYSLQVRMGRMDGIFVAFHNTQRIFGFQYIPLPEMDLALHGTENITLGDREFKLSLHLLNKVLDKATAKWPEQSLQIHFETRPSDPPFMYIFAKPVTQEEIEAVQTKNKAQVEAFESEMMGMIHKEEEGRGKASEIIEEEDSLEEAEEGADQEETSLDVWEDMMGKVEETLENDELGVNSVREAIEDALEQSGLLQMESTEESRHYLDALLEALTSEAKEGNSAADDSDNNGLDKTGNHQADSPRTDTATENREHRNEMSSADEQDTFEVTRGTEGQEENRPLENDHSPEPTSEASSTEEGGSSDQPSLKDLIIKLAAKFQASPVERLGEAGEAEAGPQEGLSSDSIKLRKFEKILSEMMRKSPELGSQRSDEQSRQGSESTTTPTTTDDPASTPPSSTQGEASTSEDAPTTTTTTTPAPAPEDKVLGMVLTIRNKVDGKYVKRPERLAKASSWTVEYSVEDLSATRANRIYDMVVARRRKTLRQPGRGDDEEDGGGERNTTTTAASSGSDDWAQKFQGQLEAYSKKGRAFRERENEKARAHPVRVYGAEGELRWEDVFTDEGGPAVPKPLGKVRE